MKIQVEVNPSLCSQEEFEAMIKEKTKRYNGNAKRAREVVFRELEERAAAAKQKTRPQRMAPCQIHRNSLTTCNNLED